MMTSWIKKLTTCGVMVTFQTRPAPRSQLWPKHPVMTTPISLFKNTGLWIHIDSISKQLYKSQTEMLKICPVYLKVPKNSTKSFSHYWMKTCVGLVSDFVMDESAGQWWPLYRSTATSPWLQFSVRIGSLCQSGSFSERWSNGPYVHRRYVNSHLLKATQRCKKLTPENIKPKKKDFKQIFFLLRPLEYL